LERSGAVVIVAAMHPPTVPLQQVERTFVLCRGRKLGYFGGCDYFRLSSHPAVHEAVRAGLARFGLNVAASRATTGHHRLYDQLERRLAEFFDAGRALLFASGYVTNLAVAQTLAGRFTHALLDARAHASLADAAPLLGCPVIRFQHRDPADVARIVQRLGRRAKLILLSDGLFSHDGAVAPLRACLEVLPRSALVLVDDAHGAGVLGATGQGTLEHEGVGRARVIQTVALSKAFGVYGGAVLCDAALAGKIRAASRVFNGNTPLPLPLVNGALAAVGLLASDASRRARLQRNADFVKAALREAGWRLPDTPAPIVSFVPRHAGEAARLKRSLLARGVFPSFIRYPGGPADGCFRFAISSEHSRRQLAVLAGALLTAKPGR
jgi:7-keto-8-aminopelargonate synthetase-like enzyme